MLTNGMLKKIYNKQRKNITIILEESQTNFIKPPKNLKVGEFVTRSPISSKFGT